ncbi:hypothetical protein [Mameliella sediminis]|uniref:hypothetical protein n=1 Tax=Mameliella sediminis TaxID=2836866 RepID=UPI001C45430D|nr:hypothetical protein [Mameliella sediminis]MBY6113504.1 hypothetical protein [Antarctobacter heliothermus]MBY6143148.1 hypothetical protein [Mameliella alba]MBV7394802.1 hypothetical protein [Mameliella sediminis]MBY6160003.1 hypothetical protein [Mameliella alba]MBY6168474.1 hypothetical protein [Mameliella alba]
MGRVPDCKTEATARIDGAAGSVDLMVWRLGNGRRLLRGRPHGYLTRDELAEAMHCVVEDPRFGADLPTLWDFRGHDFAAYGSSEFRTHAFIIPRFPGRKGIRRGYLVDSDMGFGTLRMFQGTASGYNFEDQENLAVSYSLEELVDWLLG